MRPGPGAAFDASSTPFSSKTPGPPRRGTGCWASRRSVPGSATSGYTTLLSQSDLSGAISSARGRTVGPILLVFIGVILLAEQLWPAVRRPLFSRAQVVDAIYLALFAVVVLPLLTVVETGAAVEIGQHAHFLELGRLPARPPDRRRPD